MIIQSFIGTWKVHFFCDAPVCTKISHNDLPVATSDVARINASSNVFSSILSVIATALEPCAPTSLDCLHMPAYLVVMFTDDDERLLSVEFKVAACRHISSMNSTTPPHLGATTSDT